MSKATEWTIYYRSSLIHLINARLMQLINWDTFNVDIIRVVINKPWKIRFLYKIQSANKVWIAPSRNMNHHHNNNLPIMLACMHWRGGDIVAVAGTHVYCISSLHMHYAADTDLCPKNFRFYRRGKFNALSPGCWTLKCDTQHIILMSGANL